MGQIVPSLAKVGAPLKDDVYLLNVSGKENIFQDVFQKKLRISASEKKIEAPQFICSGPENFWAALVTVQMLSKC